MWFVQRDSARILQGGAWCRYLFYDIPDTKEAFG